MPNVNRLAEYQDPIGSANINPSVGERGRDFANWAASKNHRRFAKEETWKKICWFLIETCPVKTRNKRFFFPPPRTSRVRLNGKWQLWNDHFKCERPNGSSPFDVHEIYSIDLPDFYLHGRTDHTIFKRTNDERRLN